VKFKSQQTLGSCQEEGDVKCRPIWRRLLIHLW